MSKELDFIQDYADGKIELGKQWGCPKLDRHWLWKRNFTVVLGKSGTGKTKLIVYMELAAAIRHNHKVLIYTSENNLAVIKMELIQVLAGQSIRYNNERKMSKEDVEHWYNMLLQYAVFLKTDKPYTWGQLRGVIEHTIERDNKIASIIVDPYNSLRVDKTQLGGLTRHDYDLEVLSELENFSKVKQYRVILIIHGTSESARRVVKDKGSPYFSYEDFPKSGDAEGGSKFKNRSHDFIVLHRIHDHPTDNNLVFIKVDKVKEKFTGGTETVIDAENFGIVASWNFMKHRFYIDGVDIMADLFKKQEQPIDDFRPEITGDFAEPEPVVDVDSLPF